MERVDCMGKFYAVRKGRNGIKLKKFKYGETHMINFHLNFLYVYIELEEVYNKCYNLRHMLSHWDDLLRSTKISIW